MKKILKLTVIMLLVSSCGLLKKKSKAVESQKYEAGTTMQGDFRYDHQTQIKRKANVQSFAKLDGESKTEFEGEDITLEKNGNVRMGKGKVIIHEIERSNTMQLVNRTEDINYSEKKQASHAAKQRVAFKKVSSKQVSKPEYHFFIWFFAALIIMIFLWFRWLKKKIK
ncbi:hypothetical protein [Sphingobacterium kitahiroshimense]|uniref:Lipoprotein n=1 Tax=Sphingobacterium kitahiroshimense TaxID=470446 RepID=A0ABV0BYA3_9SPHI